MSSEARLYTFSPETREQLKKFRMTTSKARGPQAVIYVIDKKTYEIRQDDATVYTSLNDIEDALPENSPRYILLSYPMTTSDGRMSVPYVMVYYLPKTCNAESRMMYAGAKELMRNTSETGRVIDIDTDEDIQGIPARLGK
ncbi:GMF family protein [Xylariaceae sp. FL0255]|nr:GMF family protein [Xylariaceae sp. FL0255]